VFLVTVGGGDAPGQKESTESVWRSWRSSSTRTKGASSAEREKSGEELLKEQMKAIKAHAAEEARLRVRKEKKRLAEQNAEQQLLTQQALMEHDKHSFDVSGNNLLFFFSQKEKINQSFSFFSDLIFIFSINCPFFASY
jgi:hypothetical protein